ncbi:MAG: hypothetical protein WB608_09675 [Terracidiphilus sp.]
MALRTLVCLVTCTALIEVGFALTGQSVAGPTAYTVTANDATLGAGGITKTYRLGQRVMVDQSGTPKEVAGSNHTVEMRTLYDLDKKESLSWDPVHDSASCVKGMFSEDWGDPFGGKAILLAQGARQVGAETLRGFATKIVETPPGPKGTMRIWVDTATGLVVKQELTPTGEGPQTVMEVTKVSLSAPDASLFLVPESCGESAALTQPRTTISEAPVSEISTLTGGEATNFVDAMAGPESKNSCTVAFRVVRAGTMEPVADGFQVAVDLNLSTEKTPHYNIGVNESGKATFAGGGLHEVTALGHGGVFRFEDVPAQFEMDLEFGPAGAAAAKVFRQCFAPQTVLLYVVKDPANLEAGGGWLWVKGGKYATIPR